MFCARVPGSSTPPPRPCAAHPPPPPATVSTFARTTGDLKFLSKVDVHVLALTYMVAAEARGWADLAEDITTRLRRITDKAAKIAIPGAPAPQPAPSASTAAAPGASGAQPPAAGTRSAPKAWGKPAKASGKKPTFAQLLASATAEEGDGGDAPAPAAAEPPSAGRVRFAEPTPEVPDFGQDAFPTLRPAAGTAEAAALPQRMAPPSWPPPGSEGQRRPVGTSILALVAQDTARKAVSAALSTIRAQYPEPEPEPEPVGGDSAPHAGGAASGGGAAASRSHILSHGVAQGSTVRHVKAGEEDDGPAWVTPGNLAAVLSSGASFGAGKRGGGDPVPVSPVACVTVDFTMQNVLLGMGLRVLAADGRRVKRSKQFVLKCDSCFQCVPLPHALSRSPASRPTLSPQCDSRNGPAVLPCLRPRHPGPPGRDCGRQGALALPLLQAPAREHAGASVLVRQTDRRPGRRPAAQRGPAHVWHVGRQGQEEGAARVHVG